MKTKLILASFLALGFTAISQVNTAWPATNVNANAGLGTSTPSWKLDVLTNGGVDGLNIATPGTGANDGAVIYLDATAGGGTNWSIASLGSGFNAPDTYVGDLDFYNQTNSKPSIHCEGSTGYVGINNNSPISPLDVKSPIAAPTGGINYIGINSGIWTQAATSGGGFEILTAIQGEAAAYSNGQGSMIGLTTWAHDGYFNTGGYFTASGNSGANPVGGNMAVNAYATGNTSSGANTGGQFGAQGTAINNIGVTTYATGASSSGNIGAIFAAGASITPANDWGVMCFGRGNFNGVIIGSDRKLKDNVKPIVNVIEKIKQLKPCSYKYKRDEFKAMNFPIEEQMGLIAQEVESIFPLAVTDVIGVPQKNAEGKDIKTPDFKGINYISLIPVLISGMQEQQKQIEDLQAQLAASQNKTGSATGINQINSAVDGFALDQNIPNPFSQETMINYSLPEQIKTASLIVYDLSGKQITSFPLELNAKSITITSDKLSAGIYIYSVMADGKIMDSKRMVVADKQ